MNCERACMSIITYATAMGVSTPEHQGMAIDEHALKLVYALGDSLRGRSVGSHTPDTREKQLEEVRTSLKNVASSVHALHHRLEVAEECVVGLRKYAAHSRECTAQTWPTADVGHAKRPPCICGLDLVLKKVSV